MNLRNLMCAVAMVVAGAASSVSAATAVGPICDQAANVNSTTYYNCSGSSHTALDIGNASCGEWNHRGMLVGSYRYTYFGGCAAACYGSNCNGWNFRQLHIYANVSSSTKTCDRCALGLVGGTGSATGPHVHADNRQYGTRKSAWYVNKGTTCGTNAYCGNTLGVPTL